MPKLPQKMLQRLSLKRLQRSKKTLKMLPRMLRNKSRRPLIKSLIRLLKSKKMSKTLQRMPRKLLRRKLNKLLKKLLN
jgi:hypothetical protein